MAIETLTAAQEAKAEAAETVSLDGSIQSTRQGILDVAKKTTDEINKLNQSLAKLPEQIIENIQESIKKLMAVINGYEDPSDPSFDPNAVIDKLTALLDPVVGTLTGIISSIGLPAIPGLSQISGLLSQLKSMKPVETNVKSAADSAGADAAASVKKKLSEKLPEIPQEYKRTLEELLVAIQSLMITLPMICVQILFKVVDLILGTEIPIVGLSFYSIIGMVPYVREVPQLVQLTPKITDLITNASGQLKTAVEGKIKQIVKQIQDMSIPEIPSATPEPKKLPTCPADTKEKTEEEKKAEETAKAEEEKKTEETSTIEEEKKVEETDKAEQEREKAEAEEEIKYYEAEIEKYEKEVKEIKENIKNNATPDEDKYGPYENYGDDDDEVFEKELVILKKKPGYPKLFWKQKLEKAEDLLQHRINCLRINKQKFYEAEEKLKTLK